MWLCSFNIFYPEIDQVRKNERKLGKISHLGLIITYDLMYKLPLVFRL